MVKLKSTHILLLFTLINIFTVTNTFDSLNPLVSTENDIGTLPTIITYPTYYKAPNWSVAFHKSLTEGLTYEIYCTGYIIRTDVLFKCYMFENDGLLDVTLEIPAVDSPFNPNPSSAISEIQMYNLAGGDFILCLSYSIQSLQCGKYTIAVKLPIAAPLTLQITQVGNLFGTQFNSAECHTIQKNLSTPTSKRVLYGLKIQANEYSVYIVYLYRDPSRMQNPYVPGGGANEFDEVGAYIELDGALGFKETGEFYIAENTSDLNNHKYVITQTSFLLYNGNNKIVVARFQDNQTFVPSVGAIIYAGSMKSTPLVQDIKLLEIDAVDFTLLQISIDQIFVCGSLVNTDSQVKSSDLFWFIINISSSLTVQSVNQYMSPFKKYSYVGFPIKIDNAIEILYTQQDSSQNIQLKSVKYDLGTGFTSDGNTIYDSTVEKNYSRITSANAFFNTFNYLFIGGSYAKKEFIRLYKITPPSIPSSQCEPECNTCENTADNCVSCKDSNMQFITADPAKGIPVNRCECPENSFFQSETLCVCNQGLLMHNDIANNKFICVACSELHTNCKVCDFTEAHNCETCRDGFALNKGTNPYTCDACSEECATCKSDNASACLTCNERYIKTVTGSGVIECDLCGPAYPFPLPLLPQDTYYCKECFIKNVVVDGGGNTIYYKGCYKCIDQVGMKFHENKCSTLCNDLIDGCDTCTSIENNTSTKCHTCSVLTIGIDSFERFVVENQCFTCEDKINNCQTCVITTGGLKCSQCKGTVGLVGYYLNTDHNICYQCPSTCLTCTDAVTCTSCQVVAGIMKVNESCLKCEFIIQNCTTCIQSNPIECSVCDTNYFLDKTKRRCASCTHFQPYCLECDLNSGNVNCVRCDVGNGYYMSEVGVNGTCQKFFHLIPNCKTAVADTEPARRHTPICISCDLGYIKYPDHFIVANREVTCKTCQVTSCEACKSNNYNLCESCEVGFFKDTAGTYGTIADDDDDDDDDDDSICTECSENCGACTSNTSCDSCEHPLFLCDCSGGAGNCAVYCGANALTKSCQACSVLDLNCDFCLNETTCLVCKDGFYLKNGDCDTCISFIPKCQTCVRYDYCATCDDNNIFNETTKACEDCTQVYHPDCDTCDTNKCLTCGGGKFVEVETNQCKSCSDLIAHCTVCIDADTCDTCETGYFKLIANSVTLCSVCLSPCATCTSQVECLTCLVLSPPVYLEQTKKKCLTCSYYHPNCLQCGGTPGSYKCTQCDSFNDYFPDDSTKNTAVTSFICKKCPEMMQNCEECTDGSNCTKCTALHVLMSQSAGTDSCVTCDSQIQFCNECHQEAVDGVMICDTCLGIYIVNSKVGDLNLKKECKECSDYKTNCIECDNSEVCKTCDTGFYNNAGTCTACMANCKLCNDAATCTTCDDTFFYVTGSPNKCSNCLGPAGIANCRICKDSTTCDLCDSPFKLSSSGNCELCSTLITNCQQNACYNYSACFDCEPDYFVQNGLCVQCLSSIPGCITCHDTDVNLCNACDPDPAKNLILNFEKNKCDTCANYIGECITCSAFNICTKCKDKFYIAQGSTTCQPCHENCATCQSPYLCQSCVGTYHIHNNFCHLCSEIIPDCTACTAAGNTVTCTGTCSNGKLLDSTNTKCDTCENYQNNCLACSSYDVCISCEIGYAIQNNICVKCETLIDGCPECKIDTGKVVCRSASNALRCPENNVLLNDVGGLVINSKCESCFSFEPGCVKCFESAFSGTAVTNKCTECESGYQLKLGLCEECSQFQCTTCSLDTGGNRTCEGCISQHYLENRVGDTDHVICYACNTFIAECKTCISGTKCYECNTGFVLNKETENECKVCTDYIPNCQKCVDSKTCELCDVGYHFNHNTNTCISCAVSYTDCTVCSDFETCQTCSGGKFAKGSVCKTCSEWIPNCNTCQNATYCNLCETSQGYYLSANKLECVKCHELCTTCALQGNNVRCLTCIKQAPTDDPNSDKQRYLLDPDTYSCEVCHHFITDCQECTQQPFICKVCKSGTFLFDNQCKTCENWVSGCSTCTANLAATNAQDLCTACKTSTPLKYQDSCHKCSNLVSNCLACDLAGGLPNCLNCDLQMVPKDKVCKFCKDILPYCQECTDNTTCTQCNVGYYLNTACIDCNTVHCTECISATDCSACVNGYFLTAVATDNLCKPCNQLQGDNCITCLTDTTCSNCKIGYYLDVDTLTCILCSTKIPFCTECENDTKCLNCGADGLTVYLLVDNFCKICSTVVQGCSSCNSAGQCQQCSDLVAKPRYLNEAKALCETCGEHMPNCLECTGYNTCTKCSDGYYIKSGVGCLKCESPCKNCLSSIQCIDCITESGNPLKLTHQLYNGYCQPCKVQFPNCLYCSAIACTDCESDFPFKVQSDTQCIKCSVAVQNCKNCDPGSPAPVCNADSATLRGCEENYYLNGTNECKLCSAYMFGCASCTSYQACLVCLPNYNRPTGNTGDCKLCSQWIADCVDCDYSQANVQCSTCSTGKFIAFSKTSCLVCPSSLNCKECKNPPAAVDDSAQICSSCIDNYFFDDLDNLCKQCNVLIPDCVECHATKKICLTCSTQKFYNAQGGICQDCNVFIANCAVCGNASLCTNCVTGYTLINNQCQKCGGVDLDQIIPNCHTCASEGKVCLLCEASGLPKYYPSDDRDECKSCVQWMSNCETCTNYNTCTKCATTFYIDEKQFCSPCVSPCTECTESTQCSKCETNYLVASSGSCQHCIFFIPFCQECSKPSGHVECSVCTQHYFYGIANGKANSVCKLCDVWIDNCVECETSTKCLKCQDEQHQTYLRTTTHTCQKCSDIYPNCHTCKYNVAKDKVLCISCIGNGGLKPHDDIHCQTCEQTYPNCQPNSCKGTTTHTGCLTCNDGYFADVANADVCTQCPQFCETCESSTKCLKCAPQYYKETLNDVCKTCVSLKPGCLVCESTTDFVIGKCIQCDADVLGVKYILKADGTCKTCASLIDNCIECDQENICTTCKSTPPQYVFDYDTRQCILCSTQIPNCAECEQNTPVCKTCTDTTVPDTYVPNFSKNTCRKCSEWMLKCIACSDYKTCVTCADGYYTSQVGGSILCLQCEAPCLTCRNNKDDCLSCDSGITSLRYFPDTMKCLSCEVQYINCLTCETDAEAGSADPKCKDCQSGFYLNTDKNCSPCSPPLDNCLACSNSATCTQCEQSYLPNALGKCDQCPGMIEHCETCVAAPALTPKANCTKCTGNKIYLRSFNAASCKECFEIIANCVSCSQDQPDKCQNCPVNGYYLPADKLSCQACPGTCTACTDSNNCTACKTNFFLKNDSGAGTTLCLACENHISNCSECHSASDCNVCAPTYIINDTGSTCKLCDEWLAGCKVCETFNKCIECNDSQHSPSEGSCVGCGEQFSNCDECDSDKCIKCGSGNILASSRKECKPCAAFIPNCKSNKCNATIEQTYDPIQCTECESGYYLSTDGLTCSKCNPECTVCSVSANNCSTCISSRHLDTDNICKPCEDLINNCHSCTGVKENITCTSCPLQISINQKTCQECSHYLTGCSQCKITNDGTDKYQCLTCTVTNYFQKQLNNACKECSTLISQCQTCIQDNARAITCTGCKPGFIQKSSTQCIVCEEEIPNCSNCVENADTIANGYVKCSACANKQYFIKQVGQVYTCEPCIEPCLTCTDGVSCDTWKEQHYLVSGNVLPQSCATLIPNCGTCDQDPITKVVRCIECSDTTKHVVTNNGQCGLCTDLIADCTECVSNTVCKTCKPQHYQKPGQTIDIKCNPCNEWIEHCTDCIESGKKCNTCDNSGITTDVQEVDRLFIHKTYKDRCVKCSEWQDNCLKCSSFENCEKCADGYFKQLISGTRYECRKCVSPCKKCTEVDKCLECVDTANYRMEQNESQCIICQDLVTNCKTCSPSPDGSDYSKFGQCTECKEVKYKLSINKKECKECKDYMHECLTCNDNVICNSCTKVAGQEYFIHPTTDISVFDCKLCTDPKRIPNCAQCNDSVLKKTICDSCQPGFILNDAKTRCDICQNYFNQFCKSCSSDKVCTDCDTGHFLITVGPITECQLCNKDKCETCITVADNCLACSNTDQLRFVKADTPGQYYCETCKNVVANCQTCDTNTRTCQICETVNNGDGTSTQYLPNIDNTLCILCSTAVTGCQTCNTQNKKCITCADGYFKNSSGLCDSCSLQCANCTEGSKCESCPPGKFLSQEATCEVCTNFIANCNVCVAKNECQTCTANHLLNLETQESCKICLDWIPKCEECFTYRSCKTCEDTYFIKTVSGNDSCEKCQAPCTKCTAVTTCTECEPSYIFHENTCKKCHEWMINCLECSNYNTCLVPCEPDQYVQEDIKACKQCAPRCTQCVSNTKCLKCIGEGAAFRDLENQCQCRDGYFETFDLSCQKCSEKCGKCEVNAENCIGLCTGANRINPNQSKSCACLEDYYQVTDDGDCLPCIGFTENITYQVQYSSEFEIVFKFTHVMQIYDAANPDEQEPYVVDNIDQYTSDNCARIFKTPEIFGSSSQCKMTKLDPLNSLKTSLYVKISYYTTYDPQTNDIDFYLRYWSCSQSATPTVTKASAGPYPQQLPTTEIMGAFKYSNCDTAQFRTGEFSGDGKQSMKKTQWKIMTQQGIEKTIPNVEILNVQVIEFPTNVLQEDSQETEATYKIQVILTNAYGLQNTIEEQFIITPHVTSSFSIQKATPITIKPWQTLRVPIEVAYKQCEFSDQVITDYVKLLIFGVENGTQGEELAQTITNTEMEIYNYDIPAYTFTANNNYIRRIVTSTAAAPTVIDVQKDFTIVVEETEDLYVSIKGGDQQVSYAQVFNLIGLVRDLDIPPEGQSEADLTTIKWECYNQAKNNAKCAYKSGAYLEFTENKLEQQYDPSTFQIGDQCKFILKVTKGNKKGEYTVVKTFIENPIPSLDVVVPDRFALNDVNMNDYMLVQATTGQKNTDLLSYEIQIKHKGQPVGQKTFKYKEMAFRIEDILNTQVNAEELQIAIRLTDPSFQVSAIEEFTVQLNKPPVQGKLRFTSLNNVEISLKSLYTFTTTDFIDENQPLMYRFSMFKDSKEATQQIKNGHFPQYETQMYLTDYQLSSKLDTIMPRTVGTFEDESLMLVEVKDSFGAVSNATVSMHVIKIPNEEIIPQTQSILTDIDSEQDRFKIVQTLAILTTDLNLAIKSLGVEIRSELQKLLPTIYELASRELGKFDSNIQNRLILDVQYNCFKIQDEFNAGVPEDSRRHLQSQQQADQIETYRKMIDQQISDLKKLELNNKSLQNHLQIYEIKSLLINYQRNIEQLFKNLNANAEADIEKLESILNNLVQAFNINALPNDDPIVYSGPTLKTVSQVATNKIVKTDYVDHGAATDGEFFEKQEKLGQVYSCSLSNFNYMYDSTFPSKQLQSDLQNIVIRQYNDTQIVQMYDQAKLTYKFDTTLVSKNEEEEFLCIYQPSGMTDWIQCQKLEYDDGVRCVCEDFGKASLVIDNEGLFGGAVVKPTDNNTTKKKTIEDLDFISAYIFYIIIVLIILEVIFFIYSFEKDKSDKKKRLTLTKNFEIKQSTQLTGSKQSKKSVGPEESLQQDQQQSQNIPPHYSLQNNQIINVEARKQNDGDQSSIMMSLSHHEDSFQQLTSKYQQQEDTLPDQQPRKSKSPRKPADRMRNASAVARRIKNKRVENDESPSPTKRKRSKSIKMKNNNENYSHVRAKVGTNKEIAQILNRRDTTEYRKRSKSTKKEDLRSSASPTKKKKKVKKDKDGNIIKKKTKKTKKKRMSVKVQEDDQDDQQYTENNMDRSDKKLNNNQSMAVSNFSQAFSSGDYNKRISGPLKIIKDGQEVDNVEFTQNLTEISEGDQNKAQLEDSHMDEQLQETREILDNLNQSPQKRKQKVLHQQQVVNDDDSESSDSDDSDDSEDSMEIEISPTKIVENKSYLVSDNNSQISAGKDSSENNFIKNINDNMSFESSFALSPHSKNLSNSEVSQQEKSMQRGWNRSKRSVTSDHFQQFYGDLSPKNTDDFDQQQQAKQSPKKVKKGKGKKKKQKRDENIIGDSGDEDNGNFQQNDYNDLQEFGGQKQTMNPNYRQNDQSSLRKPSQYEPEAEVPVFNSAYPNKDIPVVNSAYPGINRDRQQSNSYLVRKGSQMDSQYRGDQTSQRYSKQYMQQNQQQQMLGELNQSYQSFDSKQALYVKRPLNQSQQQQLQDENNYDEYGQEGQNGGKYSANRMQSKRKSAQADQNDSQVIGADDSQFINQSKLQVNHVTPGVQIDQKQMSVGVFVDETEDSYQRSIYASKNKVESYYILIFHDFFQIFLIYFKSLSRIYRTYLYFLKLFFTLVIIAACYKMDALPQIVIGCVVLSFNFIYKRPLECLFQTKKGKGHLKSLAYFLVFIIQATCIVVSYIISIDMNNKEGNRWALSFIICWAFDLFFVQSLFAIIQVNCMETFNSKWGRIFVNKELVRFYKENF